MPGNSKRARKLKPYGPAWVRQAYLVAKDFISIYPCGKCNYPVIGGYCCTNCGDTDPETTER